LQEENGATIERESQPKTELTRTGRLCWETG